MLIALLGHVGPPSRPPCHGGPASAPASAPHLRRRPPAPASPCGGPAYNPHFPPPRSPRGLRGKRWPSGRGSGCAEGGRGGQGGRDRAGGQPRSPPRSLPAHSGGVLPRGSAGGLCLQAPAGPSLRCTVRSINLIYTLNSYMCPGQFGHIAPSYGCVIRVPIFWPLIWGAG